MKNFSVSSLASTNLYLMSHINEKIDLTVEVFVVHENKVLLRMHDKYGIWLSVGGHVELDEDPNEAALREVREEVGLDVVLDDRRRAPTTSEDGYRELIPPAYMNRHRISPTHEHVTCTYFARSNSATTSNEGREQSSGLRWFKADELTTMDDILPRIRFYAQEALRELSS